MFEAQEAQNAAAAVHAKLCPVNKIDCKQSYIILVIHVKHACIYHLLQLSFSISNLCLAERCAFRLTKDVDLELQWSEAVVFAFAVGQLEL